MKAMQRLPAGGEPAAEADAISSIGADMAIVGEIVATGAVAVYGRLEGGLSGARLLIGNGGSVAGSVSAQEVIILGRLKGTVRAIQVRLLGRASVEGDIFHQQLSMEEETSFEGSSRPLSSG